MARNQQQLLNGSFFLVSVKNQRIAQKQNPEKQGQGQHQIESTSTPPKDKERATLKSHLNQQVARHQSDRFCPFW